MPCEDDNKFFQYLQLWCQASAGTCARAYTPKHTELETKDDRGLERWLNG